MPTISRIDPDDREALATMRRLISEYETSLDADLRVPYAEAELAELPQRYPAPGAAMLLAHDDGRPIGCVVVSPVDAASAEVKRLYVVPQARGTGAGRMLLQACVDFAAARGHARLVLDTERDRLKTAYALYLSMGFVHCERYSNEPLEYENPTYMELSIETATRSRADS